MTQQPPIQHADEPTSNTSRAAVVRSEPKGLRTFTPTQAVLARSAGIYHWTPEGRRLFDFTSGVLVSNLGHNPTSWMNRFTRAMGWSEAADSPRPYPVPSGYTLALPMTAYNAVTPLEVEASVRLIDLMRSRPGGGRMQHVMWAASGSEAIQKAIWAAMARDRTRPIILATRFGFHGKKGLPIIYLMFFSSLASTRVHIARNPQGTIPNAV